MNFNKYDDEEKNYLNELLINENIVDDIIEQEYYNKQNEYFDDKQEEIETKQNDYDYQDSVYRNKIIDHLSSLNYFNINFIDDECDLTIYDMIDIKKNSNISFNNCCFKCKNEFNYYDNINVLFNNFICDYCKVNYLKN